MMKYVIQGALNLMFAVMDYSTTAYENDIHNEKNVKLKCS